MRDKGKKEKTSNKVVDLNTNTPKIISNVNYPNTLNKRQKLSEKMKKT